MNPHLSIKDIPSESINEFFRVKQELQKQQYLEEKNGPANSKNASKDEHGDNTSEYGANAQSKIDAKAKSKKDHKRDFHCGCGKSYLSYPALYTHIKTKHDGKNPEGTLNSTCNNNRRGRPRRNNDEPIMKNEETKEKKVDDMTGIYLKMVAESDLKILEVFKDGKGTCEDFVSCFPTYRGALKVEIHPFCGVMKGIQNKIFREEITLESCTDSVIGVYLWCATKFVNAPFFRVMSIFFRCFRECLNDKGNKLLEDFALNPENNHFEVLINRNPSANQSACFANSESVQYVLIAGEYFILKYLPKYLPSFDQTFGIYLLLDFANWLRRKQLTKLKLDLSHHPCKDKPISDYIPSKEPLLFEITS